MTDKVQKIREEVQRLFNHVKDSDFESDSGAFYYLKDLLEFVDSLQEEKVPKFKVGDTVRYKFNNICTKPRTIAEICGLSHYIDKDGNRMDMAYTDANFEFVEEPVSEDLNTAAKEYANNITEKIGYRLQLRRAVCFGAQWKEEQFEKNRLEHCNNITNEQAELEQGFVDQHLDKYDRMPTYLDAIEYGMRLQKEQMMEQTIDGIARPDDSELWCDLDSFNLKDGNKVKVIIIKEE